MKWKLVPVEPIEAMLRDARSARMPDTVPVRDWIGTANEGECASLGITWPEHPHDRAGVVHDDVCDLVLSAAYRAMLSASPPPPDVVGVLEELREYVFLCSISVDASTYITNKISVILAQLKGA
jgi:hypothetical protein